MGIKRNAKSLAQDLAEIAEDARLRSANTAIEEGNKYLLGSAIPYLRKEAARGERFAILTGTDALSEAARLEVIRRLQEDGFTVSRAPGSTCLRAAW